MLTANKYFVRWQDDDFPQGTDKEFPNYFAAEAFSKEKAKVDSVVAVDFIIISTTGVK